VKITIRHRWNSTPVAVEDVPDDSSNPVRAAVEQAIARDADLTCADLTRADLTRADLTDARLTDARLTGAVLTDADLTCADLTRADLTDARLTDARLTGAVLTCADLTRADLTRADLTDARLTDARLTCADLTDADLTCADLTRADLTRADLTRAKQDFRAVLDAAPDEVAGLLLAIREGRINGSYYEGECACLKGTIANVRGCRYDALGDADALRPDSHRPSERLFMGISPGHVPAINPVARIVEGWILEWQAARAAVTP
jgi:hypothetical protein